MFENCLTNNHCFQKRKTNEPLFAVAKNENELDQWCIQEEEEEEDKSFVWNSRTNMYLCQQDWYKYIFIRFENLEQIQDNLRLNNKKRNFLNINCFFSVFFVCIVMDLPSYLKKSCE